MNPLLHACYTADLPLVKEILAETPELFEKYGENSESCLHAAVISKDEDLIEFILTHPMIHEIINHSNADEKTAVILCSELEPDNLDLFFTAQIFPLLRLKRVGYTDYETIMDNLVTIEEAWPLDKAYNFIFPGLFQLPNEGERYYFDLQKELLMCCLVFENAQDTYLPGSRFERRFYSLDALGDDWRWRTRSRCRYIMNVQEKRNVLHEHPLFLAIHLDDLETLKLAYELIPSRFEITEEVVCAAFEQALQDGSAEILDFLMANTGARIREKFNNKEGMARLTRNIPAGVNCFMPCIYLLCRFPDIVHNLECFSPQAITNPDHNFSDLPRLKRRFHSFYKTAERSFALMVLHGDGYLRCRDRFPREVDPESQEVDNLEMSEHVLAALRFFNICAPLNAMMKMKIAKCLAFSASEFIHGKDLDAELVWAL